MSASVALVVACGGAAGPPAGPKHIPENSEEAATECPKERKGAQEAREALLGRDDPDLRRAAAQRVMAHAECERNAALQRPLPGGTQDQILTGIRALRAAVRDASNLFGEVVRYDVPGPSGKALLLDSQLTMEFARRLDAIEGPSDLEGREAMIFRAELADARRTLEEQAVLQLEQAATMQDPPELHGQACALLAEMGRSAPGC